MQTVRGLTRQCVKVLRTEIHGNNIELGAKIDSPLAVYKTVLVTACVTLVEDCIQAGLESFQRPRPEAAQCTIPSMERHAVIVELDRALSSLRLLQSFELPAGTSQLALDQANRIPQLGLYTTVSEAISALQDIRGALSAQYPLLPPEIMSRIFRLVAQGDRSFCLDRVTHVCRRWRYIAINDPSLWTNIRLNVNARGAEYTTTLLQRSGALPLSIDFECATHDANAMCHFARLVMTQYRRIRRLRLSTVFYLPPFKRILASYCAYSWDALESLFIAAGNVDLLWKTVPQLRFLSIRFFDSRRNSPSSFCFATLRSLCVDGAGKFDLTDWSQALSRMPRLEELYLDIYDRRAQRAFGPFGIGLEHIHRSGTIKLKSLRRITIALWSSQIAQLLPRLEYPEDVLVTLLLPTDILVRGFRTLFKDVLLTIRRKIGLDDSTHIRRCHVTPGLGRDHTDIEMALHSSPASPPFFRLRFDTNPLYGKSSESSFYALVLPYLDNDSVEYLGLPLKAKHFNSFVGARTTGHALFMPNIRQLKVPHIELDDIDMLSTKLNGLEQMVFPKLETLIVDPPMPRRPKGSKAGRKVQVSEEQWAAMIAGLVPALELRRDQGSPLQELVLGPHARSTELLEHLSCSLPELRVKLITEAEITA